MNPWLRSALLPSLVVVSGALRAEASQILPVSLPQIVAEAHFIVAGTVARIEYGADSMAIFTRVTLGDLVVAKGAWPGDSMTFRVPGGVWKGQAGVLVGFPKFELQGRYVLCLDEGLGTPADHYHSIVYWNQGFFPITEDGSKRKGVVHDCDYRPVVEIERGTLVVLGIPTRPTDLRERIEARRARGIEHAPPPRRVATHGYQTDSARIVVPDEIDPGTSVDEAAFLKAIGEILKQQ